MEQIRVNATLTNAMDEILVRRNESPESALRKVDVYAIADESSVRSMIPESIRSGLGVLKRRVCRAELGNGQWELVELVSPIVFDVMGRDTIDEAIVYGDEVVIGRTVINKLDLFADCVNRRLIPNPAHPDQPVSKV